MGRNYKYGIVCPLLFFVFVSASTSARPHWEDPAGQTQATAGSPAHCIAAHDIGKLNMSVSNNGTFGTNYSQAGTTDFFTGETVRACEYPKGSRTVYMYGSSFWIGAVLGRDTLVSTGADGAYGGGHEFSPEEAPLGNMIYRSTIDPAKPEYDGAVSELDLIAVYSDTCTNCPGLGSDPQDNRPHKPLNIEVTQRSYSWSYAYAEDFVLFDYAIRNIGHDRLRRVYMGVFVDADVHQLGLGFEGYTDDICGFRLKAPASYMPAYCPPDSDLVNIAWIADNDGDMDKKEVTPVPHITGMRIIRTPSDSLQVSFNWWVSNADPTLDFGPQSRDGFRPLSRGGTGTPGGDRDKYYFLRNGEFDYDQVRTADIDPLDPIWLQPNPNLANDIADGFDTRYLISFGPFDIEAGQTLPLSLAYVAGENFHTDPSNVNNLPPGDWREYYANVDFSDLELNSTWAEWIYDNPGYDSDNDSIFGEFTICNKGGDSTLKYETIYDTSATPDTILYIDTLWVFDLPDTIWRKGDGVPDFRGASPPPGPSTYTSPNGVVGLRVEPQVGQVRVRWNGVMSENTRDVFSREFDFEGYRVYIGRDERRLSYTLVTSFDKEDYNKYVWDASLRAYRLLEHPYVLSDLRTWYGAGDTTWNPLNYTRNRPYVMPGHSDSIFYFEAQDFNRSILANDPLNATTDIMKTYPDAPKPPWIVADSIPDSLYSLYLTDEGFFKYYEYEVTIDNLLATVPYWVNVTSFDYGSPRSGLAALETNPTVLPIVTYPLESVNNVVQKDLKVFVYPNPYRIDADYRGRGFEGRGAVDRPTDRTRAIHFANLPPKCTIRVYSLDGDLIRELPHDVDPTDPLANHDTWDLVTRNTQLVVSGLYYWTVEDEQGKTQIGKLVIIL